MLIRGQNSSHLELSAACFTKANYGVNTNTTLSVNTPRGVLGGSVAGLSATQSYTAVPCTRALMPAGLFANDAAGAAFENAPALASNKVAVVKGLATVEVDVYETRNIANNADLVYAAGQKLYCSDNGFLTNEASTSQVVIGVVVKAPTTASPTLGVDMRI
jgi:hypothetical protein